MDGTVPASRRPGFLLWLGVLVLWLAVWLFPVSNQVTRALGLWLFVTAWGGLIALSWRHRVLRHALLAGSVLAGLFLALPGRSHPDLSALRAEYVAGLRRYTGVTYYWGGESPKGIDCSGLMRRGLVDALFLRGVRTLDAGPVRQAASLWWHDTTAEALGACRGGFTREVRSTPAIRRLGADELQPGDLAVTSSGIHILAYVGEQQWIEADPVVGKVIVLSALTDDSEWLRTPMNIVRWEMLSP